MARQRPRVAQRDEVMISREGRQAVIEFRDGSVGATYLTPGFDVHQMTDTEILAEFNRMVLAMQHVQEEYKHVAVEVPAGSPQIRYSALSSQWVPRGDVMRCELEDMGPGYETVVVIDGQRLSMEEFGRLLAVHNGWGMRIVFIPDDELDVEPRVEVREPDN